MAKVDSYLLGMDCGTTNIKAIILGEDGTVVAEASRPSKFMNPGPNMHEQDANEWWSNTIDIFKSLTEQAGPEVSYSYNASCRCRRQSIEKCNDISGQSFCGRTALYCRYNWF